MLLEGPGAWGGAQQSSRAGVGRGWEGALSLVKAEEEPGLSTGLEGRLWRAAVSWGKPSGGGLARTPPDSVSDSQNSAGGRRD